jgi:D-3-phosphoglycerate dehydrogenase
VGAGDVKVLVTCPPMLGLIEEFIPMAAAQGIELVPAEVTQTLSESELIARLPDYDGWIIGDDPASRQVIEAGVAGRLKAAVKWGVGVDNVDFDAFRELGIPVAHTPMMFGDEVADVAVAYVIGLARQLFFIDREVRSRNAWPKPPGVTLGGKSVGVVGLGDIGGAIAKRLVGMNMLVTGYDPGVADDAPLPPIRRAVWPREVETMDFLVFACALTPGTRHMHCKPGVFIVNVSRGQVIDERALAESLESGHVKAAALEVFEEEPLPASSALRRFPQCVFGTHNSSNTSEAVRRASVAALERLTTFLFDAP